MDEEQALRIVRNHATEIVGVVEHLEPNLALSSVESAFIWLIYHCIPPEKRRGALDSFLKHASECFELSDRKAAEIMVKEGNKNE